MSNLAITIGLLILFSLIIYLTTPPLYHSPLTNIQIGGQLDISSNNESVTRYNPVTSINGIIPRSRRSGTSNNQNSKGNNQNSNGQQLLIKSELKNELQQGLLEIGQFELLLQNLNLAQLMSRLEFNVPLPSIVNDRIIPAPDTFDPEVEIPKYFKLIINELYDFTKAIYQLYEKKFITNGEIIYPNLPASSRQQLAQNEFYVLKYFQELIKPIRTLNQVNSYQMDIFNSTDGQLLRKALFLLYDKLLPYLDQKYTMIVTGGNLYELMPELGPEYSDEKWSNLINTMSKVNGRFYKSIPIYQAEATKHQYDDLVE